MTANDSRRAGADAEPVATAPEVEPVAEAQPDAEAEKVESRSFVPPDPEPWPEQVDGAELLDALVAVFHRHLSLPEGAAEIFALWVVFAHAFEAVDVSPRLVLTSPEPECGKTTALSLLGRLVPRRILASNVTPAVIFRAIERYRPTMLIDEADTFIDASDEMAGILNSGHQPETAFVWRCDGDDHEPRGFSTWSPLAIARIGDDLPAPLRSRSIVIRMQRARCDENLERLRAMHHAGLEELCRKGARWAADHLDVLRDADPEMPEALRGRAADNWRPLISIADAAGGCWPETARRIAVIMSGGVKTSTGVLLLRDTRQVFEDRGCAIAPPEFLVECLCLLPDAPWATWSGGARITPHRVARLLGAYGIASKRKRSGRYYDRQDFEDAWASYCADPPPESVTTVTPVTPLESKDNSVTVSDPVTVQSVTPVQIVTENPNENNAVTTVTDVTVSEGGEP